MRPTLLLALALAACRGGGSASPDAALPDAAPPPDALPACVAPDSPFAWPVPTAPVAITPSPAWKLTLDGGVADPFVALPVGSPEGEEVRWVKFAVLLRDPTQVYFQDSRAYPFHYEFATEHLDPFRGLGRAAFDAVSLRAAGQEVVLGAVLFPPRPAIPEIGIQLVGQDVYHPEMVRRLFELVAAHVTVPAGTRALYLPVPEQARCAAGEHAAWLAAQGVPVSSVDRWLTGNACYAPGWAIGVLREVPAAQIDAAYLAGTLGAKDILFTDAAPAEVPYVAGILTTQPSTPNSHTAILARSYGVPFAYLRAPADAARARALVGRLVVVSAGAGWGGARRCDVRFIDVEGRVDAATEEALRALGQPPPLAYPPKQRRGALTVSTEVLGPADSATVGGKAANFGILRDAIPEDSPVAIAVPFDLWDAFLDQTLPPAAGGQRLRDAIAARLAGHVYPPDLLALDDDLAAVRALIETQTAFAPALRQGVEAGLVGAGFDPRERLRFRSSTNVEDGATFTGAGLYTSVSGCLADDQDGDEAGPSLCNAAKPDERGVYRAVRKVFASFYGRNAVLERLRRGVREDEAGMALLVHPSVPDEEELANGVVTLSHNSTGSDHMTLVTQLGAASITNPDGSARPEVVDIDAYGFGTYLSPVESSSLVPLGAHVLAWEDDYRRLADDFTRVADRWQQATGTAAPFLLDLEYKKVAPGLLSVKQVRPIPAPDQTRDVTPYLVNEPRTLCVFQGESGDVFANHRLKSRWLLESDDLWLAPAALAQSFYARAEVDYLEGAAVARLAGRPRDFAGAAHGVSGEDVTDAWSVPGANARVVQLGTRLPGLVRRDQSPVVTLADLWIDVQVTWTTPVPAIDWMGIGTRRVDRVTLQTGCPDDAVIGPEHPHVTDTVAGPGGLAIATSYWFPPPPTGATAGYTAPLVKWDRTTITGLTSQPIVLVGTYAQTYRPAHHNFGAEYIFEPRLEPGLDPAILAELAAADIQYLYVDAAYSGMATVMAVGFDGVLRPL